MTTLTIQVPENLKADLVKLSRLQRRAMSDIVREVLRRHVATERFRQTRKLVLPFAEAQGLLTDEDVLRALE